MKENLDLVVRVLVSVAASLVIYVSVISILNRDTFGLEDKAMLYHHEEFIVSEISKRVEKEQIAKGKAFKFYMETGDASLMVKLDMVLVDENGTITQDIDERFKAKTEAYKYFRETGDNSKIIKYMEK